ncbi:type 4a pilus biogenesis protein PilO [Pseudomonas sp. S60]|uniref:pilus assembly protein PilP n=1 Tax=Pseudomonas sp. S60 TaxID=211124 RepID=UPI0019146012|nr:pilus assembly protein PilP [Pseudomonas sp. S60]MBK5009693.1 type 4a pilus biogenesis protein PilO [Pseudomonas sp. S60]
MNTTALLGSLAIIGRTPWFRRLAPWLLAFGLFTLGCMVRLPTAMQQQRGEHARSAALEAQHTAAVQQLAEREALKAKVATAERHIQEALWYLDAGQGMSDLLERLSASAGSHGVLIEQLQVRDAEQQAGLQRVPLELQVTGPYRAVRVWLNEWFAQPAVFRSGDLAIAGVDGQPAIVRLRLHVDTYQAKAPPPSAEFLARLPARQLAAGPCADPFAPRLAPWRGNRLTGVPLKQVQMVGHLSRGDAHEALVVVAGTLYRLRTGDRVGRDNGVVVQVTPGQVEVQERLFMTGVWHPRTAFLSLQRRTGKEAPVQDENIEQMAADVTAAAPGGGSVDLSG